MLRNLPWAGGYPLLLRGSPNVCGPIPGSDQSGPGVAGSRFWAARVEDHELTRLTTADPVSE